MYAPLWLSVTLCVIAVVSLVITLWLAARTFGVLPRVSEAATVFRDVQSLKLALADVADRVQHWQRRDRVRRLREGREAAEDRDDDDERDGDDIASVSDIRDLKRVLRERAAAEL